MEEAVALVRDMMANPKKYGFTAEHIHQWALESINVAAETMPKIPECLQDVLSDDIITAYKERKIKESKDNKDEATPAGSPS